MRRHLIALFLAVLPATASYAQSVALPGHDVPFAPQHGSSILSPLCQDCQPGSDSGRFASTRKFSNFIGFMSNPLQSIDPRSLSQVVPLFTAGWISTGPVLPNLDAQVLGPAMSIALTDRFCVGLNQGGYAFLHIDRNDRRGPIRDRLAGLRGREFGGSRDGFLDLGGFAQYTLIEDVEGQFLATVGSRLIVPIGSSEVFQGNGPALLAPYVTVGKEFGPFHVLATTGYQFPLRTGDPGSEVFYLNGHLDCQVCDCFYPLVEVNWSRHTNSIDVELPTRRGAIDFGNFVSIGRDVVTVAAGLNVVVIRDRLEVGGAYIRTVNSPNNIDVDSVILKMILRY